MLEQTFLWFPGWLQVVVTTFALIGYLVFCLGSWYLIAGLDYAMNSGQLGRSKWLFPFECFLEEVKCHLPGGQQYRIAFIKDRVRDWNGFMIGRSRNWSHSEIRWKKQHEDVYFDMMGGHLSFWSYHFTCFFGGFLILGLYLALLFILMLINLPYWAGEKYRGYRHQAS